ncbi:hypothetical protein ABZ477_12060 [Microbacterium sp. NPDC019599]|uniref:hypothetical protein n=1 Tax=Microbacterium sp. NPDC019599 TaxID=3154690 RepID=UPI0034059907
MDANLLLYGSAASRAEERRRLDRDLERRRVIRERLDSTREDARVETRADRHQGAGRGIRRLLRVRPA